MQEYTALPVLYASQWFLTCFSCPFPAKFACRVIDVLLQEAQPHVLLRVALAVVAECEADILELHDFEDIITFLKVLSAILMALQTACMPAYMQRSPNMYVSSQLHDFGKNISFQRVSCLTGRYKAQSLP